MKQRIINKVVSLLWSMVWLLEVAFAAALGFALRLLWIARVIHVPQWDNTPSPYKHKEVKAEPKKEQPTVTAARPENVKDFQVGPTEIGKDKKYASYKIDEVETQGADIGWSFTRYDGKGETPDLTPWSDADEYVIRLKMMDTEVKRANYIAVRELVLLNKKNREIALALGKKISWAETYGAACRLMVKIRLREMQEDGLIDLDDHSPTQKRGEEEE